MQYGFGVDIGGTTIKIGLFSVDGDLMEKWEIPTNKTDNGKYVLTSSSNRPMAEAFEWKCNQSNNQSESGGFHFQLSLPSGEGSAEDCMELAREWIETISNGKAKYIIAVHTNTNNIHAHIAVDKYLKDGKVWDIYWKRDQKRFREISDRICVKHGFSVLEETRNRSLP